MALSREQKKAMFAKKSGGFQVGDKVVNNPYSEKIFNLPKRPIKVEKLPTSKVISIKNVKTGKDKGLIVVKTDNGITGGIEHFEKFKPNTKFRLLPNQNLIEA